jgi:hypothetical protein
VNTIKTVHELHALLLIAPVQLVQLFRASISCTCRYYFRPKCVLLCPAVFDLVLFDILALLVTFMEQVTFVQQRVRAQTMRTPSYLNSLIHEIRVDTSSDSACSIFIRTAI